MKSAIYSPLRRPLRQLWDGSGEIWKLTGKWRHPIICRHFQWLQIRV